MKTRRFDIDYKPLTLSQGLEIVGSIPNSQQYDAITGEYTPDYSLVDSEQVPISPLVFQPHVYMHDMDEVIPDGEVTKDLTNLSWKWIEVDANGTTTTTITTTTTYFTLDTSSTNTRGRLTIKKNVPVNKEVSVVFEADYLDTRTGQSSHIYLTERVILENVTETVPNIMVNNSSQTMWHPCRDNYNFSITAKLLRGTSDFPAAQRTFVWEKHRGNGVWSTIGSETYDDYGWSISQDGATFSQDMRYMGDKLEMRVRASYTGHTTLDGSSPCVNFSITRRIPEYDYDFINAPEDISADTDALYLRAVVQDKQGVIANASNEFLIDWNVAPKPTGTTPSWTPLGSGDTMFVKTTPMAANNAMIVGINVEDKGARKIVVNGSGAIVLNGSGSVVFDR